MKALQYRTFGQWPEVVEVERPRPGPGQVLLRVTAAGVCHSDLGLLARDADTYPYGSLPLTLGHEGAGVVAEIGAGVAGVRVGEPVVVYGPWGCGRCRVCATGAENHCPFAAALGIRAPGLGSAGSMAQYQLVNDARHLVPLGDLDPVRHVCLTDAGLTPYHAIRQSLPRLLPGSIAVVVGVGGLGHVAVQMLRALCPATVVAVDIDDDRLALARGLGAQHAVRTEDTAELVAGLSRGTGAAMVLDLVGSPATTDLAARVAARGADVSVIGVGGGAVPVGYRTIAFDASVRFPYWGSRPELFEVLEMAAAGQIRVEVETYSLDEAPVAYRRLAEGRVRGRAVVVPD
ncbi:Alcohol dehydrogenase [Frankia canadensis]|uniref:alcohol dehydrogenase n=1 Tax=Frankia canadensis TaxID=1836972 RepID=A0A2I2KY47_9ACTN|nr:alcohol dehydrogenase catalytic domain-containing protein [Frankia canadensis]SNQ50592.1 Alcohol dehydrogenase [Frankia canadensis]SOU57882.1 Alcohol dehydrogenase [Frankia canadensis]